jgi:hypothetical protein
VECVEGAPLVDERPGDLFAQRRLGCCAEAGQHVVIGGNRVLAAVEHGEGDPLVDERLGDLFAQRQLGCCVEAGQHVVIGGNRILAAVERGEGDPLVDERPCLPRTAISFDGTRKLIGNHRERRYRRI